MVRKRTFFKEIMKYKKCLLIMTCFSFSGDIVFLWVKYIIIIEKQDLPENKEFSRRLDIKTG